MKFASELYKKYNVPGPRYTSYPTVPYWNATPTAEQWIETIRRSLRENRSRGVGAALYVHLPFCESLCTYCGCNTRITRNHSVAAPYVQTLLKELDLYLARLGALGSGDPITIEEMHFGGGTPTFLAPSELETLIGGILSRARATPTAEFSIEADPRVTKPAHLEVLARLGFKRLSLGIQDFDPKVQDTVNRIQSVAQVRAVVEEARRLGFTSVNFDLIYGLPFQTTASVRQTIEAVRELKPDRIAFYGYAHVPWIKPGQRKFTEADLPAGDAKRELYEIGRALLEEVGYREVGMDHFALETDSLWKASQDHSLHRNFMGYISRQVAPLLGLGVSAIGDSWYAFAQNEKHLESYQRKVEAGELPILRGHLLDDEDRAIRRHILNLMTRFETDWSAPELHTPYLDGVALRLSELAADGLLEIGAGGKRLRVTEKGVPFLRNICMALDARLVRQAPATQLFSKTI